MKKLITEYESNQLEQLTEQPYIEEISIQKSFKYNKNYGDNKLCACGHSYYRHFDSYENMEAVGCKYCDCYEFINIDKLIIVPQTVNNENLNISGCFLHGKIEEDAGFDMFAIEKPEYISINENKNILLSQNLSFNNIFECLFNGKECKFFYWNNGCTNIGLVVYSDDKEAYDYAMEKFKNKETIL